MFKALARHRRFWAWLGGLGSLALVGIAVIRPPLSRHYQAAEKVPGLAAFARPSDLFQIRALNAMAKVELVQARNTMIVHRTELSTRDFDKSRRELDAIVKQHDGYLGDLMMNAHAGSGRYLEAILRVPADQLGAVMTELKTLGHVESESQTGEDVTEESVDLDARLTNARHSERRLSDLQQERTGKLADILAVEKETTRVRGEIERMEAQRKGLTNRIDFAALKVGLLEQSSEGFRMSGTLLMELRNAAAEGYKIMVDGGARSVLLFVRYAPSVLFWSAVLFFPVRLVWRKSRRHLLHSL